MRITSGGKIGIGVTDPNAYYGKQLVVAAADESGITIMGTASNQKQYLCWASNSTGANAYAGFIAYDHNTNAMSIATNGGAGAIAIDNAQKVGIGTASPTTKFQVVDGFFQHSASKSHNSNVNLFSIQFSAGSGTCKGAITVNITGSRYSPGNNDYAGGAVYHLTRNNVGNVVTATQYTFGTWQPAIDANNSTKTWTFSSAHFGSPGNHTSYSVTIQGAGHQTTAVKNPVVTIL